MASQLAEKKCKACKGGEEPLKGESLRKLQEQLDEGWDVVDEHELRKTYTFQDFRQALAFANMVGDIAEEQEHHPELTVTYGKAEIKVWTHKIDGLTESDFIFAAKVDALV